MTRIHLERQLKDLKTQKDNLRIKLEIAGEELKDAKRQFETELKIKDKNIAVLQKNVDTLTQKLNKAIDLRVETMQERIDAAVAKAVAQATTPLVEELKKAHVEIGRLKAIINKDSSNSSKPPSKGGFKTIPNSREKSSRTKGGQKGHPGHRLTLPENMDELEAKGFIHKRVVDHTDGSIEYISRFVIDTEVITTITEHRFAKDAQLPTNLYNEVSYGDNIKAMSVLLLNEGIIAEKRMSEIMEGLTHGVVKLSPATLEHFQTQFAEKLEQNGELNAIKEDLQNGEGQHTDDTPMKCTETIEYEKDGQGNEQTIVKQAKKQSFRVTVRTHSNDRSTFYTVNPKKDIEGIERDGILPDYVGILSHDHESKFYNYGTNNSTCGGHLTRDLKGLRDLQMVPWAGEMRKHMQAMNRHKNKDLAADKTACNPNLLEKYENKYDQLLKQGRTVLGGMKKKEFGYAEFNAMVNRLTKFKDNYLLFMRDYKVPFTNNLAERDLRAWKVKEKVSMLFNSWHGIKTHTKNRSFISTLKKRKIDLFSSITQVIRGSPVLR